MNASTPALHRGEESRIISTGRHTYGLSNINIKSWGEGAHLYVGGFCSIAGKQTVFLGGNHRTDWTTTFPFGHIHNDIFPAGAVNDAGHPFTKGHVRINNDVWIGHHCTIMSGVTIGSGSVIAAHSVVVKDVEPYSIVGGNPAKTIKQRFPNELIERLLAAQWWNQSDVVVNSIVPLLQQPLNNALMSKIEQHCRS